MQGYLVFSPATGWWKRILKKDYGHVSLVIRQGWYYIWIEPSRGFTEVKLYAIGTKLSELFPDATQIIPFTRWRDINQHRVRHLLSFFTCTEQIKAHLGINNALLLTPWQLAKYLTKED